MTHLPLATLLYLLTLTASKLSYKDMASNRQSFSAVPAPVIPLHRLEQCPTDKDSFLFRDDDYFCKRPTTTTNDSGDTKTNFTCSFTQFCFGRTMEIDCTNYVRNCDLVNNFCQEEYGECTITRDMNKPVIEKAPGVASKLYPECIPALDAIRDECNATVKTCNTSWHYDPSTDDLLDCMIDCTDYNLSCYNYTRYCEYERTSVVSKPGETVKSILLNHTLCNIITIERELDEDMRYNKTTIQVTEEGEKIAQGMVNYNVTLYHEWTKEDAWEECVDVTQVSYEPQCNEYIANLLDPLLEVIYEPAAYNLSEGIKMFLQKFDGGYEILCKFNCYYKLIKFSRECWPRLPLQRFLPGADYRIIEMLFRNMSRIACYVIDAPETKYEDKYMNARNSCAVFFDPQHNLTRPFYENITRLCVPGSEGESMCESAGCTESLDAIANRFGCCLGSIVYQYTNSIDWLKLWNFADNPVIPKLVACGTQLATQCETQTVTALSVVIVRNLICVIGGVMTLVVVVMTISFYWQLEHEPIKKAFYHF